MAVNEKARKILWGRSGNRCAICKHELILSPTPSDDESVVGDECHIVSNHTDGPRYYPTFPKNQIDSYKNLILLCRVHHKMVDDQCKTYTSDTLRELKLNHEKWVSEKLSELSKTKPLRIKRIKENIPSYLTRLVTGKEVLDLIEKSYMFSFNHDELQSQKEVEIVGGFLQTVQDWGDIGPDLGAGERVRIGFELTETLKELEDAGFIVFGGREIQVLEGGNEGRSNWPVVILRVLRKTNEAIIKVNLKESE